MDETLIPKINSYKRVLEENLDDFVNFLYANKILDEKNYREVWKKGQEDRIHEIFKRIHCNGNLNTVLKYLKDTYPNHEKEIEDERNFTISSIRGGFPELPPHYVSRRSLVDEVKRKLQDLRPNQKLIIHGMVGYGKSCLINDVLRDKTVRYYFRNRLFWINLGDCHGEEDVWQPMWRLCTSANIVVKKKISSININDLIALKDLLITIFSDEELRDSLIILDDASNSEILKYFDIGSKTVITTQNRNILGRNNENIVEVKTGFSAIESLELFKKSVKVSHDLPSSAEEIHNLCQGHPLLISLIGSFLNENAEEVRIGNNQIWQYVKDMFKKGNYSLNEFNNETEGIPVMINKCIEKLLTDDKLRNYYQDLAIFDQEVNIPPRVLEILWNKSPYEVRNIMNTLTEKSLIVRFYHDEFKTYIYGIHDIFLTYIKKVTENNTKELHRKLLDGYDKVTDGDYSNLPNDNYTLQFIGHHMFHGEYFSKFKIYFNLKFLELKLKAVGTEDVLRDMKKYEIYITRKENSLQEKLNQYKDFIRRCGGNLYSFENTDIIQYALRESRDSHVFKDALQIAKASQHLYFKLQKPCEELDYSQIINIKDDITSACFVDSPQHILIGTTNGRIKLFYEQSVKEISSFIGHRGAITNLIVSPDKRYFLSVSTDGVVMMWKFAADSSRNSRDFTNEFPISPKAKQSYWQDIHTADRGQILPRKKFKTKDNDDFLVSAAFCDSFPDTHRIATGSNKGNVIIWDVLTETVLYETGRRGIPASCILYKEDDGVESLIFGCQDSILIFTNNNDKLQYDTTFHNNENCNSLFCYDNKILAVGDTNITVWDQKKKAVIHKNELDKNNICSTLTNDHQYLVISTNKSTVYIWNILQEKCLREFQNKGLAKSLDTFYDEDKSVHILLIGSDKKTLQQCHIQPHEREPQVENSPVFVPYWKKKNALTATASQDNKLQIFSSYTLISESSEALDSPIRCTCFSVCGSDVIYGMENGDIRLFNIRTRDDKLIEKGTSIPVISLMCYDPKNTYHYRRPLVNSGGSSDSLDCLDTYTGVIVSVLGNNTISIYNENNVFKKNILRPVIFSSSKYLVIVDAACNMYTWNMENDNFLGLRNPYILETVTLIASTFCQHKSLLVIVYEQCGTHFCDIYHVNTASDAVEKIKRLDFNQKVTTAKFSCDGSLLAIGMMTGAIKIYNINENYKNISLELHEDPIQDLIFPPHKEPILVSVAEEIAWWSLKSFKKTERNRGRPNSIDILEGLTPDFSSMDISFWSDRLPLTKTPYLLSLMKLNDKAKYVSASNDFNSFFTIDASGKIYIMDIINSDT